MFLLSSEGGDTGIPSWRLAVHMLALAGEQRARTLLEAPGKRITTAPCAASAADTFSGAHSVTVAPPATSQFQPGCTVLFVTIVPTRTFPRSKRAELTYAEAACKIDRSSRQAHCVCAEHWWRILT